MKNLPKIVRNLGIAGIIISPVLGYLYVESKMKVMEQGIHDDLSRIRSKGKTLADIPRKIDWFNFLLLVSFLFLFKYFIPRAFRTVCNGWVIVVGKI